MPYYLIQAAYTPQAMAGLIQSPQDRARLLNSTAQRLSGKVEGAWLAFGDYDLVAILQMPNDEAMAALAMAISAGGRVRGFRTTPLLSIEEGVNAAKQAADIGYRTGEGSVE